MLAMTKGPVSMALHRKLSAAIFRKPFTFTAPLTGRNSADFWLDVVVADGREQLQPFGKAQFVFGADARMMQRVTLGRNPEDRINHLALRDATLDAGGNRFCVSNVRVEGGELLARLNAADKAGLLYLTKTPLTVKTEFIPTAYTPAAGVILIDAFTISALTVKNR